MLSFSQLPHLCVATAQGSPRGGADHIVFINTDPHYHTYQCSLQDLAILDFTENISIALVVYNH